MFNYKIKDNTLKFTGKDGYQLPFASKVTLQKNTLVLVSSYVMPNTEKGDITLENTVTFERVN